ncbi:MAG: class I SAM-dependent methyltransferase [Candidatus Omnitrophota bacterium]|nr:class I SAM-dependent methyltransferase [bacterium]MBU3929769.1 class I SAM-dependent methyltransferase [bacterium]MBU4123207.1 class I SAM-dependent methyltransferase [bacterium]
MIKIINGQIYGSPPDDLSYIGGRGILGRLILPMTRFMRYSNVKKYIIPSERLLDIGCGDAYFLQKINCREKYGIDKLMGEEITDKLDFPDNYFDYITMLAVIEHVKKPDEIISEIHRALKPGGKFIFTTPRKSAEKLIRLYAKDIDSEHESYFDYEKVEKLAAGLFRIYGFNTFIFGMNQVFALEKI